MDFIRNQKFLLFAAPSHQFVEKNAFMGCVLVNKIENAAFLNHEKCAEKSSVVNKIRISSG